MIKTRFAPSPSGFLHLGSSRTALYSYAYAKKIGGECHYRVEDSDKTRSTYESLVDITEGLEWLGIKFDKGPSLNDIQQKKFDKEHFQSLRKDIYDTYIDKLINEDKAYIDKDGVTVFKMPQEDIKLNDAILGDIIFPSSDNKDFAIRRADGNPLFHIVVVVDDALAGITHIIRGQDHLPNLAKHHCLYIALGFPLPIWGHMVLILDQQGQKLSKRRTDQPVLIKDFRANGYLPSAIINQLGLLGWGSKTEEFDMDHICTSFDLKDCSKSNPRYDPKKLAKINSNHIQKLTQEEFDQKMRDYGQKYCQDKIKPLIGMGLWEKFLKIYKDRAITLKFPFDNCSWLVERPKYKNEDIQKIVKPTTKNILGEVLNLDLGKEMSEIAHNLELLANNMGIKQGEVMQPCRLAITGLTISPPVDRLVWILGDEAKFRMNEFIQSI